MWSDWNIRMSVCHFGGNRDIMDQFGIAGGHVETVHSYTNDQNLIDNYHPKVRRGRAAGLNMVITETGAAKAVAKAMSREAIEASQWVWRKYAGMSFGHIALGQVNGGPQ